MTRQYDYTPEDREVIAKTKQQLAERNGHADGPKADASHGTNGREVPGLVVTCAAGVSPKPLTWLVPDMFPLGKLVLLAGDGGLGKSTITLDLAARLSRGESAFGLAYEGIGGDTLIASCEDDPADTVVPRLLAAGADLNRIHFLDGVGMASKPDERPAPWSLAHHQALSSHLEAHREVRLVVIDPASAFAGRAGIDGHKDAELRALLGPLSDLAATCAATVLLVAHVGKRDTTKAVQKVLGSVGWVNAVRSAWIVAERAEDSGKRLLMPMKSNLSPRRLALAYQLTPLDGTEREMALDGVQDLMPEDRTRLAAQLYRRRDGLKCVNVAGPDVQAEIARLQGIIDAQAELLMRSAEKTTTPKREPADAVPNADARTP